MTHYTNLAIDLSLLDLGPVQLFLMSENCRQKSVGGSLGIERLPHTAPCSYQLACVCIFRRASLPAVRVRFGHMFCNVPVPADTQNTVSQSVHVSIRATKNM